MRNLHLLEAAIHGRVTPGLYRWRSEARPDTVAATVEGAGWRCAVIDGTAVVDRASFDAAWAAVTPATDAGTVVVYDDVAVFAGRDPRGWAGARDAMEVAVGRAAAGGRPLLVLLRGTGGAATELPEL